MNKEAYFVRNTHKLREVYEVFRNTRHGVERSLPPWSVKSYQQFVELPLLDPKEVDFQDLFIPADNLWCFATSGVSGHRKSVYRDIGTIVEYPPEMDAMLRGYHAVFLHSKRREGESYYETHDVNHRRMYPQALLAEYETREDLLEYAHAGDVLFVIEYPLMAEWICYQLETALEREELTPHNLRKKKVYLELSGEPVTRERVANIVERLEKIFNCGVECIATYGSNEIGHIGTCIPAPHMEYEIIPSLFVEMVDGEIVITQYRTLGTILFRYKMGDTGTLFFKEGKPFLRVFGKSRDEGMMYVAGAEVSIPELVSRVESMVDLPIGIECVKEQDQRKGECQLTITIHLPLVLTGSLRDEITSMTRQYVASCAVLSVENELGMVKTETQFSTEPIKKRWFIINGEA